MAEIKWRCERYGGSNVRDMSEVLQFEIAELENEHIVRELIDARLIRNETFVQEMLALLDAFEDGELDEIPDNIGERLAQEINESNGLDLKYAMWLADKDYVRTRYAQPGDDMDGYEASAVVLSRLGPDGSLYAYEDMPRPVAHDVT